MMQRLLVLGWVLLLFQTNTFASDHGYPTWLATLLPMQSIVDSSRLPKDFFRQIALHNHWRTSLSETAKIQGLDVQFTHSSKTWDTRVDDEHNIHLRERLALTLQKGRGGKFYWNYSDVDLTGKSLDLSRFSTLTSEEAGFSLAPNAKSTPNIKVRFYGTSQMVVSVESADGSRARKILFTPYEPSIASPNPSVIEGKGLWTAPLGALADVYRTSESGLPVKTSSEYLHHDLSQEKPVYISANFPSRYLSNLENVLQNWNKHLGAQYFRLAGRWPQMNKEECLLRDVLCILWHGGEEIRFLGMGGGADWNFDPETGIMHGGVIDMDSLSEPGEKFPPASQKYVDAILNDTMDIKTAAEMTLQTSQFFSLAHPTPGLVFESVITHEIGHFGGFAHNFLGSVPDNTAQPSMTVMEYSAFPVGHKRNLGEWDERKIRIQYRNGAWGSDYLFCSDDDAKPKKVGNIWKKPFAACNHFDLGEPIDWYLLLVAMGAQGPLTPLFAGGDDPGNPPKIVLTNLAYFLTSDNTMYTEKTRIVGYLCTQPQISQIKEILNTQFGYDLSC